MEWSDNLRSLGALRSLGNLRTLSKSIQLAGHVAKAQISPTPPPKPSPLLTYTEFGDNPGKLKMLAHVPPVTADRPLVVLLHGCGQDAASFAFDSGWKTLADQQSIPLVMPEQVEGNNAARCFQWYHTSDTARDAGEAGSIAAMTRAAITQFKTDPSRVFIVGLSAGAAMAVAMLAAYPELFAAGASIAGLPVGSAHSGLGAILRMASAGPFQDPDGLAAKVHAAAPAGFAQPWPRLSIWQGLADETVAPDNANHLAQQWCALHGLTEAPATETLRDGVLHRQWFGPDGADVELWTLPLLPHGYPVGTRVVQPGRFMLQAPINATEAIAGFFDLD